MTLFLANIQKPRLIVRVILDIFRQHIQGIHVGGFRASYRAVIVAASQRQLAGLRSAGTAYQLNARMLAAEKVAALFECLLM